jgi:uncharacterized delta-60 repeat protein
MITDRISDRTAPVGRLFRASVVLTMSAVVLASGFRVPVIAAGGDLDASFGTGGTVIATFPGGSYATAVAMQPDGKIVVVGAAAGASNTGEFAIARYEAAGALDTTFAGNGMRTTPIAGGHGDEARSVAVGPDGKIVVAGTDSDRRFAVVRYRSDGALDPSFGGNGIVRTNLTLGMDVGYDVALQANGKIVVAGVAGGPIKPRFAVVRYLRDGSLDQTFADGGAAILVPGGVGRSLAIQDNGRIVVTGYTPYGLTIARLRTDGRLDRSFGGDGVVGRLDSRHHAIWPLAVALQPNGKILVGGGWDIFNGGVARFTSDGKLDRTFGGDGAVRIRLGSNEQAIVGLAIQDDGGIIAAGHVEPHEYGDTTVPHIVVARLLRDGALDHTWGGNGKVSTRLPGGSSCDGVALQPDGKIVVAGRQIDPLNIALIRYLP